MWIANLASGDFEVGCPIVAAALGRSEAPAAADAAGEVFLDWERRIAAGLETAGLSADDAARQATLTVAAVEVPSSWRRQPSRTCRYAVSRRRLSSRWSST